MSLYRKTTAPALCSYSSYLIFAENSGLSVSGSPSVLIAIRVCTSDTMEAKVLLVLFFNVVIYNCSDHYSHVYLH